MSGRENEGALFEKTELKNNIELAEKIKNKPVINDLEITGQAFEDMQEQNIRLMQQLREKDDANFQLMKERIKAHDFLI